MLTVKNTKDIDAPWTHTFLYGDTGAGKTSAAATWPAPLFLVPQHENSQATLTGQDVDYVTITGMNAQAVDGAGGMIQVIREIERSYRKDPEGFPYETIVIESLSHYCDLVQEELTDGNKQMMDQQKWGKVAAHLRNVQVRLRALEVHAVYTALAKIDVDAAGVAQGGPLIPGQSGQKVPSACDMIAYMECKEKAQGKSVYRAHFRRRGCYPARTRYNSVPAMIENLTFEKLFATIDGGDEETE